jgi:MFS family permease
MSMKRHWKILSFLFTATVINYMDRQTLAVGSPLIQKEFALSNQQLGLLFSAFYFSYALSVAVIGELIDRIALRKTFLLIVAWWSITTALTATSHTFWHLFAFRMLLGVGEAGLFPATARLISLYMRPDEKTLANSFYMAGGSLGLVIVQPLMVGLSLKYGWRGGFVVIGALSSVWVIAWLIGFRAEDEAGMRKVAPDTAAQPVDWSSVLRMPRFWGMMVASFCGNTCLYFIINWLPTFMVQDRHFAYNLKLGGTMLVPYLGLDTGYMLSGYAVLLLSSRYVVYRVRRWCLVLATLLMTSALIATPFSKSNLLLIVLLFMATLGMAVWNSNYLSGVEEISQAKPAAVAGVVGSVGAFSGAISLWLIGAVSQVAGSFSGVFIMAGLLIVVGTAGILLTEARSFVPHSETADLVVD